MAIIAVVLTPWTIRNYRQFHTWMFVRGNFGLELAVSNNEFSAMTQVENLNTPIFRNIHPSASAEAVQKLKDIGEPAYFSGLFELAANWISSHPAQFAYRTAVRCLYFWFPPPVEGNRALFRAIIIWAITLLGFEGIVRMRKQRPISQMIWMLWLMYPAVYYLVNFDPRYRYPLDWSILLCAGYAVRRHFLTLRAAASTAASIRAETARAGRNESASTPTLLC